MASINISEEKGWIGAASILEVYLRQLQHYGDFPSLGQDFAAVNAGVQYLDLSELNESERAELRKIVPLIVSEIKKSGTKCPNRPKVLSGVLGRR